MFPRWIGRFLWKQHGTSLLETITTVAVLGLLGAAVLGAVQTSYVAKRQFDSQSTVENLIRNQVEYVFDQAYLPPGNSYLTIIPPDSYSLTAEALVFDESSVDIEIVQISLFHHGQPARVFDTIRTNR